MSSPFQCSVDLSQICNPGEDAPPVFSMPALTAIGLPSFDEAMNDLGCCFWRAFRQIYYGLILRPNLRISSLIVSLLPLKSDGSVSLRFA